MMAVDLGKTKKSISPDIYPVVFGAAGCGDVYQLRWHRN